MQPLGITIFIASWIVCALAWCYGVAEFIGMRRFWPWAFRYGFKVFGATLPMTFRRPALQSIELPVVKASVRSSGEILFLAPARRFSFRLRTPFPIKATIEWSGPIATVTGRLPVGTIAFLCAWLIGWTVSGSFASDNNVSGLSFVLFGWLFAVIMVAVSLPIELSRIRHAKEALIEYLQEAEQPSAPADF